MRETIYIEPATHHCHRQQTDGAIPYETDFFDGKCDAFVEGYCYEVRRNGVAIYPWKPFAELDNAQREYEKQLLAEYTEALKIMGVSV